jgi:uncharacterized protein YhfF
MHIPSGPSRPDSAELKSFWEATQKEIPDLFPGPHFQVRWIGLDHDTTEQVLDLISAHDKKGTFTLPWLVERTEQPEPRVGDPIILIDFNGKPRLLVRLTQIEQVTFGEISESHTAIDGSPVRSLNVWKPMHTGYWNEMLEPFGLAVSDDMPVLVERFELLS